MKLLYIFAFVSGLLLGVNGRAVNISSAWFLPQEGFPVFYRYFNEKVTWNEAEAICNFHHADLLSVETNNQMDAAKAYLKEIDVTDNIWIGLKKESPEKPFSWTSNEKLLGDGYWTEPIPKTNEKLCAAIDPVADFRWNSFYCRGPQLASFVCELPVPDWAKKGNGCLITSLPSLTVTFIPEVGVIQLLSDCGLDGTRRIACNADVNRDEIIKRLSCDVDAFASTTFSRSTTADSMGETVPQQTHWPVTNNHIHRYGTTKTYSHTRHRRSVKLRLVPEETSNSPTDIQTATAASVKPSTSTPPPTYEDLPVLVITGEKLNDSSPSATSENTPIVLMIENKDLEEPFLVPLSDDIFIDSSLSPVEVINVDLIEVGNQTTNGTVSPVVHKPTEESSKDEEEFNAVEDEKDVPQKPNRGRLLTHPNHPSFYPRFLNRVLG